MENFKVLGLNEEFLKGIADMGFETPSPIQEKVIPIILESEKDLVALAQTGTGKTAAFGLPILQKVQVEDNSTQVLILSPTRELCMQIGNDLKSYAKYRTDIKITCVYGGADIRRQIREIDHGVHVLVATPGRLCDLIKRGAVHIEKVHTVVLDEADEMLNMGFKEDLNFILEETPEGHNTYLFSATMPREVERIARNYLNAPTEISVGKKNQGADTVKHIYYQVRAKDCYETLRRVIDCEPEMYAIIFTRTKNDARDIAHKLQKDGIECDALHGDLSQSQRDDVMSRFRSKMLKVLVATDVAARGLDVDNLTHVINFNLPEDIESYTHRSGRTGRAGRDGISVAIINSKETGKIRRIEKILKKTFEYRAVPNGEEVCRAQLNYYANKVFNTENQEMLTSYEEEFFAHFNDLSHEDIIKKIVSYEFGRLLHKYADVLDLNLSDAERSGRYSREDRNSGDDRGRGERGNRGGDRERGRGRDRESFTTFELNVGKGEGVSPRDLIGFINRYSPERSVEIGNIRIFDKTTQFEADVRDVFKFTTAFKNAAFNGENVSLTQAKERKDKFRGDSRYKKESRFGRGDNKAHRSRRDEKPPRRFGKNRLREE